MGIYFLAAGKSSNNREKSLENSFSLQDIQRFLKQEDIEKLKSSFPSGNEIFIWGATERSFTKELNQASSDEYVVDVKNEEVVQIFTYCFCVDTADNKDLQDFIGWDREKPIEKRRYRYVFFLKTPRQPRGPQRDKVFFQKAFNEQMNDNWLVGQRWFSGTQVSKALERTGYSGIEDFLGISS